MSNKSFNVLRQIAGLWAPCATLIATLLPIWNVPCADEITKTAAAVTVFLNAVVAFYRNQYNKTDSEA